MKTIRTILAVTTIATLAACSNAPSESEINKAIKSASLKEGCKTIAIKDVKKINGMKVDDNNYLIKSEFTMVVAKDSTYIGKWLCCNIQNAIQSHRRAEVGFRDE